MRITLTVDLTEDGLKQLKTFYKAMEQAVSPVTVAADERKHPDSNIIDVVSGKPFDEIVIKRAPVSDESSKPAYSKTEVRARALQISKAGKADVLRKIFSEFGAANLKGIPEDKYAELMNRLVDVDV